VNLVPVKLLILSTQANLKKDLEAKQTLPNTFGHHISHLRNTERILRHKLPMRKDYNLRSKTLNLLKSLNVFWNNLRLLQNLQLRWMMSS